MQWQWDQEHAQYVSEQTGAAYPPAPPCLTLSTPRSHCPHCRHQIAWYENIPVLSWLLLRGRCSNCHQRISCRYPLVEITTAFVFAWCISRWGWSPAGWAWCGFSATLLTLALIDWDTTYLPDSLTLPLLWAGLLVSAVGWTPTNLHDAVWGAAAGYMSLWSICWGFNLITGKEGMGHGDFKLFAALGAWLGWQTLIPVILLASVFGAGVGIAMKLRSKLGDGSYIPFGPFLAGAGFTALYCGPERLLTTLLYGMGM